MNPDEQKIYDIARHVFKGRYAVRYATPKEDCGYQKADIVIETNPPTYLQVSHTPKSKKEQQRLYKRGTHAIHTHRYKEIPLSNTQIRSVLETIVT